jgi:hypothetical protein
MATAAYDYSESPSVRDIGSDSAVRIRDTQGFKIVVGWTGLINRAKNILVCTVRVAQHYVTQCELR